MPAHLAFPTAFAPAERADAAEIRRQAETLAHAGALTALSDAVPAAVLILNAQRQIVYYNSALTAFAPEPAPECIVSLRPGEALACVHAAENAGGCGTTEFCRECGAVRAILAAQAGQPAARECRITRRSREVEEALDLRVQATPFVYAGEPFTIFAVTDISHEKRRQALERTFFHDLNNTAGIIGNLAYLMGHAPQAAAELPVPQMLAQASDRLRDEIRAQRQLLAAENGELQMSWETVDTRAHLQELAALYRQHEVAEGRTLTVAAESDPAPLVTDPSLLGRVVGNMLKNALEASQPGEAVTAGCERRGDEVCFWVHNPAVMPRAVQLQLFQRSFSTKGAGRGLGTYSLKLLGERYLGGRVAFSSAEGRGTTFSLTLPLQP